MRPRILPISPLGLIPHSSLGFRASNPMRRSLFRFVAVCAALFVLSIAANAQSKSKVVEKRDRDSSNVAMVIVGSAAKAAWVTTKFVAKDIAKPVAKAILLKAAPKLTVFALKSAPVVAKRVLPAALKLALL